MIETVIKDFLDGHLSVPSFFGTSRGYARTVCSF